MPKRLSNEEKLKRMDKHNEKIEKQISKNLQKELVRITKKFILACEEVNKNNL